MYLFDDDNILENSSNAKVIRIRIFRKTTAEATCEKRLDVGESHELDGTS